MSRFSSSPLDRSCHGFIANYFAFCEERRKEKGRKKKKGKKPPAQDLEGRFTSFLGFQWQLNIPQMKIQGVCVRECGGREGRRDREMHSCGVHRQCGV